MVAMMRRNVGLVEILVLAASRRVAAAAAVAAAFEAAEAAAAAGLGAAGTSDDAGENGKENKTADDNDCNHGPSVDEVSGWVYKGAGQAKAGEDGVEGLAYLQ